MVEREYSYLPNKSLVQFPGGGMNHSEKPADAANRELMEELGVQATRLTLIGTYLGDHRRSRARMYVFVGEDLCDRELNTKDVYEVDLSSEWLFETQIDALIAEGKVENAAMLACWTLYKSWMRG